MRVSGRTAWVALVLAAASMTVGTGAARASTPQIGVYTGPADTVEHDAFSAWLGTEATYALDFVDDSQSWTNIADYSDWLINPWSGWVKSKVGRRVIISVPMLNQASADRLADGANGAFDGYFMTLTQKIVAAGLGNAVIRLGWEANGDWYPWRASTDPTAWKAYFRRIVGVMRSVAGQSFAFDLTYSRGTSGTAVKFETIYPGDDVVDVIGVDVYDTKWMDDTSAPEVRWNEIVNQEMGLDDFKAFAAAHGKPMSVPEWALWEQGHDDNGGVGDNPYFVDRIADWLQANAAGVLYHSYFNQLSGWTGDHRLSSYVNARARYKARFGVPAPPPDTSAPSVALTAPRHGARVAGTVTVSADATDAGGVAGVQFKLDGVDLGAEDRYAPFTLQWDTRAAANGTHVITAVARDFAGTARTAATRTVTVRNR